MAAPDAPAADPLALFHPLIRAWFGERLGTPTDVQRRAWPVIAAGEHALITAPTGSGKTLTAFLWALDRLLTGAWEGGRVRVLYVSPLKALNADVRRNLEGPLAELAERFAAAGEPLPAVRVVTRSGDTPAEERRRMVRHPPEILITTPESLNILLTSKGGRSLLGGLATVILDEIHAVAGSKRGTHLITAVERLTLLAGEFQRVALSATVKPLERVADFVGGWEVELGEGEPRYAKRPVTVVRSAAEKRYQVRVRFPGPAAGPSLGAFPAPAAAGSPEATIWDRLVPELREAIRRNRSTLVFANSRRLTERVTRLLNEGADADLAYSHHGSLSKEVRAVVEERLKRGELPAIVATSSLELGIDVGDLDEVLLVATPRSVASAVQRIGRAGHRVGEVSRGTLYPTFGRDFLDAAAVARAVGEQDIEDIEPPAAPLDVLAQVVLSMTAGEAWRLDDLYAFLRASHPYRELSRRQFDLVVEMLAGRYADARVRELRPRLSVDRLSGTVRARPGSERLLYLSGGTIPDRGYFHLRLEGTMARLGELDEEFVWERSVGDSFTLGAQAWRIRKITHNDVLVSPARGGAMAPFWRADAHDRGSHLSQRVADLLAVADVRLDDPSFPLLLAEEYRMEEPAAAELIRLLREQKAATGASLPHRRHLVIETTGEPAGEVGVRRQVILHTFWGGKVNRPLGLALAAAWERDHPAEPVDVLSDDDCVLLTLPAGADPREVLAGVDPEGVELLLRERLGGTGFFGARFRDNAARALLLPRAGFRQRTPLWLNRLRAKKLLAAVAGYGDFPLVVETWRTCLQDEFELAPLKARLRELAAGDVAVTEVTTVSPSPFASHLVWMQTNTLMYEDDTPTAARGGGLTEELLRELVHAPSLRPRVPSRLIDEFQRKVQRTWPGYAPRGAAEVVEWIKERLLLGEAEWRELLAAVERDGGEHEEGKGEGGGIPGLLAAVAPWLVRVRLPGAEGAAVAAVETLPRLAAALGLPRPELDLGALAGEDEPPPAATLAALDRLWGREGGEDREEDGDEEGGDEREEGGDREGGDEREEGGDREGAGGEAGLLADLLAEWARFYGPFDPALPGRLFGLPEETLGEALEALAEDQRLVVDRLRKGSEAVEACDAENLETLLRWSRAAARPTFTALPLDRLPLFLAVHQGLAAPGDGLEDLKVRLEQLLLYPAPAALWEGDLLPARLDPYYPSWLDTLMQESDLLWLGVGRERLAFAFPGDLELLAGAAAPGDGADGEAPGEVPAAGPAAAALAALTAAGGGPRELAELARRSGLPSAELAAALWGLAWQGRVTNDAFAAVRKGILGRFQAVAAPAPRRPAAARTGRRRRFDRWQGSRPFAGAWSALAAAAPPADALEADELAKERARLLLDRYGVLFRELCARELPAFAWGGLFRALRLMELSGEVLAGHFFAGVPGPQFASPAAFRRLKEGLPEDALFWVSAVDPASPCGLPLEAFRGRFPPRHPSTYLVFQGPRPVVVARRNGGELEVDAAPDHPRLGDYLGFLRVLLGRQFNPLKSVEVETINGEMAAASPYRNVLADLFPATRDPRALRLWRRY
jgi:ATP-dependent helicase Lhr and Lhr-like helicase